MGVSFLPSYITARMILFAVILPLLVGSVFIYVVRRDNSSNWFSISLSSSSLIQKPGKLIRSEKTSRSVLLSRPKKLSNLKRLEAGLARSRARIRNAARDQKFYEEDLDLDPHATIYNNGYEFFQSYIEMEKLFKIFVYEEGNPPLFHDGPYKGIYSTEGMFIQGIEFSNHFRTLDPDQAHVYFLPFTVTKMVRLLYVRDSQDISPLKHVLVDYLDLISSKYPFWNKTLGADHCMLSCHDWGPRMSSYIPNLFKNSIRVLCNANISEGFKPSKDASLPDVNLRKGNLPILIDGMPLSSRSIFAFFAGQLHGDVRMKLLNYWKEKDDEILVYQRLPEGKSYSGMMRRSKFCLCPSGYQVASPRIVESIYYECVPVLISDNYVPPFSDVLNWNSFSVQVPVIDIPKLKIILKGISETKYVEMMKNLKLVQRHFMVNDPPVRFDFFHMTLHSIWLRKLNFGVYE